MEIPGVARIFCISAKQRSACLHSIWVNHLDVQQRLAHVLLDGLLASLRHNFVSTLNHGPFGI